MEDKITQSILQGNEEEAGRLIHATWGAQLPDFFHKHHHIALEDARSLFGEATMEIIKRVRNHSVQNFTIAYLWVVCRNMATKVFRQNQRQVKGFVALENPETMAISSDDRFVQKDNKELVEKGLSKLDETCRKLIENFFWEDLSHQEIAREMPNILNENTSKAMLNKCKKKLREIILKL